MGEDPRDKPPDFIVEFEAKSRIFKEGDLGAEMFIIETGEVEIYSEETSKEQTVAMLTTGDFFGEMALLEGEPRYASARAATDCRLLAIDASTFDEMLRSDPEIAVRMMRKLAHRLRQVPRESRGPEVPAVPPKPELPPSPEGSGPKTAGTSLLRHEASGLEFRLRIVGEVILGRLDPATGFRPDIDLESINPDRSVSRQHAKIMLKENEIHLVEDIGAVNGTFVNGERLKKGISRPLQDGDRLGISTVELIFCRS